MNEASSHHSTSVACEYSENCQINIFFLTSLIIFSCNILCVSPLSQGPCVHVEQVKPAERWSSKFSDAAGSGI